MSGLPGGSAAQQSDLWRELALLGALEGNQQSLQVYKFLTTLSVGHSLLDLLGAKSELAQLRQTVITNIANYVSKHPKATEQELAKVVLNEIQVFAAAVDKL